MKRILFLLIVSLACISATAEAFWIWTPETNKWVNPKYAVKETPSEQLAYAMEAYTAKDYDQAIQEFKKLIKHYPRAREAAEAQFYIAKTFEDRGDLYQAFKQYQIVVETYPYSERSASIVEKQFELGNALLDGKKKSGIFKDGFLSEGYDVVDVFRTVIKNAPYGKFAAQSQYKIGLYLLEKQLYQEARDEFEKVVNDYPESEWAAAAQYQIAIADAKRSTPAQYDQKVTQAAVEELKTFVAENPEAELSIPAKEKISELRNKEAENNFVIAEFYEKNKNFDSARIYYQLIIDTYSSTEWASKALIKIQKLGRKK